MDKVGTHANPMPMTWRTRWHASMENVVSAAYCRCPVCRRDLRIDTAEIECLCGQKYRLRLVVESWMPVKGD
jgi:hypothetical protein